MDELIKREDAINAMAELQAIAQSKAELTGISKAWKRIKALPTVDAVPVTRCAQCKWWWKVNGLCTHPKHCHDNVCVHECGKDYFCADGERRNDD